MADKYEVTAEDVEYHRHDGKPILARLYRPKGAGPFPALVEVHGGAWTMNDRTSNAAIDQPLAESGAVVLALDFRMPPEARYPASVQEVNLAVRWLKAKAKSLGSTPELVGGLGTSSGAHQMLLSALRPKDHRYAALPGGEGDASLAYMVLCWPIADPLARYRMVKQKGNARLVEAHDAWWGGGEAEMADGSPQRIVEQGQATHLPPAILLQGLADDNVTPDMAERFTQAYRKAGGKIELETFEGQPHTFIPRDPTTPASQKALQSIIAFVAHQVR